MALFVMPLTVINLGGEMMYILEQRLIAQKIPPEKACKVRRDAFAIARAGQARAARARAPQLARRLARRAVSASPCAQVIADIVRTMFNAKFVDEL